MRFRSMPGQPRRRVAPPAGGVTPLANTVLPAILGTAQEGQTLSVDSPPGTWTGSPTSFTYQWRRGGVDISGATASTYVPVFADVGTTLTVRVTASKAGTPNVAAISAATGVVSAAAAVSPFTAIAATGDRGTALAAVTAFPSLAASDGVTLAVTRQGFNASGTAVTVAETLTAMKRVRNPWSAGGAQNTLTTDAVWLSDFVYTSDTLPAGVTNGSTLAYPQPIACWMTPEGERARTSTFTARLAVAHAYARSGRPVAAVKFIATDGTNTVEQTVSTMSSSQSPNSGLWSDYFECSLNISTLNAATLCTLDVIIYPWIGTAFQASVHGTAYPSVNFGVLKFFNDRTGSFGEVYAYVDAATGNNGTGVVSATDATAAANPYADISAAMTAVYGFGARNTVAGATVKMLAGVQTHVHFTSTIGGAAAAFPVEVVGMGATRADTIWENAAASSASNRWPQKMKIRNLTLRKIGNTTIFMDAAANAVNDRLLILDNVAMDLNGTTADATWIWKPGRMFLLNSQVIAQVMITQSNVYKAGTAVGCTGSVGGSSLYNAIACSSDSGLPGSRPAVGTMPLGEGQLTQHCFATRNSDTFLVSYAALACGARGFAMVGTVLERHSGATNNNPLLTIGADAELDTMENVVLIGNTVVGQRTNLLYNDSGSNAISKRGFMKFVVHNQFNVKTDVFVPADGARVLNWAVVNHVGFRSNAFLRGDSNGNATPGINNWIGEVFALGTLAGDTGTPLVADWVNDQSRVVSGTGNGDYTPGAASALPVIPAGLAPYSIDQKGRAVVAGTSRIGALVQA